MFDFFKVTSIELMLLSWCKNDVQTDVKMSKVVLKSHMSQLTPSLSNQIV